MALIIEDGTQVEDAESFASVADARAYAERRGAVLPAGDSDVEVLLIKAMDFIEAREPLFAGARVSGDQVLSWPRQGARQNGFLIESDAIPTSLLRAQCQLAVDAMTVDLMPNSTGRAIKRQKVDVIETEYEDSGGVAVVAPDLSRAMALLEPLFAAGTGGINFAITRV